MYISMHKYGDLLAKIDQFISLAEKTYGPFKRKSDGRWIILVQDVNEKFKTKSYPKYLMEKHLGKDLGELTVDHWDSNIDNNSLDNLRVIDRVEHSKQDTRRVELIDLVCDMCKEKFQRSPRLLRDKHNKGASGVFCSRKCSGKYNRLRQLNQIDKLPIQPYHESRYYKQKYRTAFIDYLFIKYASR